jgi:hypothetical protein
MKPKEPSEEFTKFKDFVRKIVSVPKSEIEAMKEQEKQDKKSAPKKRPSKVKA